MKLALPKSSLRPTVAERAAPEVAVAIRGDLPDVHAPSEIDLRGMRVGEVDDIVMHAVDAAIRADLKSLRIIHGKGTGALRERVAEMLRKESRVTNFRLGAWNEGGAGVTVVELK
jgi:DNA mismatch repair protein MutS2